MPLETTKNSQGRSYSRCTSCQLEFLPNGKQLCDPCAELEPPEHHHSSVRAVGMQRSSLNYCLTCHDWFMPLPRPAAVSE